MSRREAEAIILVAKRPFGDYVIAEPRRVRQQVADGDRRCGGARIEAVGGIGQDAGVGKGWQNVRQILVEFQLAVFDQQHRCHASHGLCHRIDTEQAVGIHRPGVITRDRAGNEEAGVIGAACDRSDGAGKPLVGDIGVEHGLDTGPAEIVCPRQSAFGVRREGRESEQSCASAEDLPSVKLRVEHLSSP